MKLYNFKNIKEFETNIIENLNYKDILLMENAAGAIIDRLIDIIENKKLNSYPVWLRKTLSEKLENALGIFNITKKEITILVGNGNNGGDALAVARKLSIRKDYFINILFFGEGKTELRIYQEELLKKLNKNNLKFIYIDDNKIELMIDGKADIENTTEENSEIENQIKFALKAPFIIDGLTGIGLRIPIDNRLKKRIEFIEKFKDEKSFVFSIDLPTGTALSSDKVLNVDLTFMIQWAKQEFFLNENRKYSLAYEVLKCDMPDVNPKDNEYIELVDKECIKKTWKKREFSSNKGNFGRVFVFSNTISTLGAPIIASKAAIKTGAGYVFLVIKKEDEPYLKASLPYIITIPYENNSMELLNEKLSSNQKQFTDSVILGSGFGLDSELFFILLKLLINKKLNIIIDGDGLNIISKKFDIFSELALKRNSRIIITPHKKEFERIWDSYCLFNKIELQENMTLLEKGKNFCKSNLIDGILLKDYISYFIGKSAIYCNNGCFSGFSKAGTGDFIAGVYAALVSNYSIDDAGKIMLFIQDQISLNFYNKNFAVESIISEDLLEQLPYAIQEISLDYY